MPTMNDPWSTPRPLEYSTSRIDAFMASVYRWMGFGLALSALTAYALFDHPEIYRSGAMIVALIVWAAIGFLFGPIANRASVAVASGVFLLYCALTGCVFSGFLAQYTSSSIGGAFVGTASAFFAMSAYGTLTKRDLTGFGNFLMMGLIGIVVASVVNLFIHSAAANFVINCLAVIVFTGMTAFQTQKLRSWAASGQADEKSALVGALMLYLSFVNLFITLLELFGRRRDD